MLHAYASCSTPHNSYKEWFPPPSVTTMIPHKVDLVAQPAATRHILPSIGVGPVHLLHCLGDTNAPDHHPPRSRFFGAAQPRQARASALCVSGDTDTTSKCATAPPRTMAEKPSPVEAKTADLSAFPLGHPCVRTGSGLLDAPPPIIPNATFALVARNPTMELRTVLMHRSRNPLTPYKHDAWRSSLRCLNLFEQYPSLPDSIQFGFDAGICSLNSSHTPPNSTSLSELADQFEEIRRNEFAKARYLGPCSKHEVEALIGPFQTSPIAIIPKPGKPGKFHAVHNFSHPHTASPSSASINSSIDTSDFPCTWGTFNTIALTIVTLPPGSQASIRDVAEAYRTIPIKPSQWPGLVIRLPGDDLFAINTCNNFGLASAGGKLADASVDIFRREGIGPISKWVDDHVFFRIRKQHLAEYNQMRALCHHTILSNGGRQQEGSRIWFCGDTLEDGRVEEFDEDCSSPMRDLSLPVPPPHDAPFLYSDVDIDRISDHLGIPWESLKTVPFSSVIPYLGFSWDLDTRTVTLPDNKKCKYLASIDDWRQRRTHTLIQVQGLYGKLLHSCLVIREGRAFLTSLEAMLAIFHDRPFVQRTPPRGTAQDLEWWQHTLHSPSISRDIPGPVTVHDVNAFSDASSGVGIGIIVGEKWRAWRLLPGWKAEGRDIGWAEAISFEFLTISLCRFVCQPHQCHVKVFGDNRGVVEGWWKGRSRNKPTNEVFRRVHQLEKASQVTFHTRYVPSRLNPADGPSRGLYPPLSHLLPPIPISHELQPFLVDFDTKPLVCEQQAGRDGSFRPLPKPNRLRSEHSGLTSHGHSDKLFLIAENFWP